MPNRQYAKSQEYRIRDIFKKLEVEAERVPLSGACAAIGKGDVSVEGGTVLVDHKSTRGKDSIRIKREDLEKIQHDAGTSNLGILTLSFLSCRETYAVVNLKDLIEILRPLFEERRGIINE